MAGVVVGAGWQAFVAYVNIGCYYIFGIPLGLVLGFKLDMGVKVVLFPLSTFSYFLVQFNTCWYCNGWCYNSLVFHKLSGNLVWNDIRNCCANLYPFWDDL